MFTTRSEEHYLMLGGRGVGPPPIGISKFPDRTLAVSHLLGHPRPGQPILVVELPGIARVVVSDHHFTLPILGMRFYSNRHAFPSESISIELIISNKTKFPNPFALIYRVIYGAFITNLETIRGEATTSPPRPLQPFHPSSDVALAASLTSEER
ncbi:hypothetical protein [Rhodococcus sp. T7]|uniref:hypothetical protein n=1 Tax=Rhodococcus sp. T7 TaxID=627444 RepID=UPI0013582A0F|nr:hypothetical protein [Rhodococcus sp. T7]